MYKRLHIYLLTLLCIFTLSGCATALVEKQPTATPPALKDGYQFGDATRVVAKESINLLILRYRYCNVYDPGARKAILEIIHLFEPDYPETGICANIADVIKDLKGIDPDTVDKALQVPQDMDAIDPKSLRPPDSE